MKWFIEDWQKFKGWAVLEFFLRQPEKKIHIKGLVKELNISPRTANVYLDLYAENGLLKKEHSANAIFFSLKDNTLTREIKKFYTIARISGSRFIEIASKDMNFNSIVLFGSHAKGTNDSESDLDLLVISKERELPKRAVDSLKRIFPCEANIVVMPLREWRQKLRSRNNFAESILKKHTVLSGSDLVE